MWCHSLPYWTCDSCEPFTFSHHSVHTGRTHWHYGNNSEFCIHVWSHSFRTHICSQVVEIKSNSRQWSAGAAWRKITWIDILKSHLVHGDFLVGFKVVKHDMTHHFNLKGQTSFHQSVKEGTWDFVSSNELTGSQVLLWLMSGTWSMWGFPPKPAGQLCPGSILTCLRRKKGEASCQKSTCFDRRQYSVFRWEKLDWKELLMLCSTFVVYSKNWSISLPSCFFCRIVLHVFAMDLANRIGKVFGKRPLCDANAFFKAGSISSNEKIAETSKLCDFRHTSCTSHTLRNECSTPTFRDKQLINRSTPKKSPLYRQQNRNFTKVQVKQLKRWKKKQGSRVHSEKLSPKTGWDPLLFT